MKWELVISLLLWVHCSNAQRPSPTEPPENEKVKVVLLPVSQSVQEGNLNAVVRICLQVVGGQVTEEMTWSVKTKGVTALEGVDFNGGVFNFTFQAGETEKCQSKEAMGLIINDGIYEFIEYFELSAFPADTSTSEKTKVVRSTGRVYIVDDEVATIGFDQPVYRVKESVGEMEWTVRLLGPGAPELDKPVVFSYYTKDGNATSGPGGDYRGDPGYPKVGSLEAMPGPEARRLKGTLKGPRTIVLGPEEIAAIKGPGPLRNQRIVLTATGEETKGFIPIVNDEIPESPESFQIVLQSSENSVYVHKYLKEATVIIEDDDGDLPPAELDISFSSNTPRIVGNSIVFQVVANKNSTCRCRVTEVGRIRCRAGETVTIADLEPGRYLIRATCAADDEEDAVSIGVIIPEKSDTCTVNLVGNGMVIDKDSVTFEFGGGGRRPDSYTCSIDRQPAVACESPYTIRGLSEGRHHFRLNMDRRMCEESVPLTLQFTV